MQRRTALVSGGSGAVGAAVCVKLARMGFDVAVCYRNGRQVALDVCNAVESEGVRAAPVRLDVTDADSVAEAVRTVSEELGPPVVLVHSAGVLKTALLARLPLATWDEVLSVNLRGAYLLAKAVLPGALKQRWGRIVFVSSVAAFRGRRGQSAYSASKAGLHGLTRALAQELGPKGVTVNAVCPGLIRTPMTEHLGEEFFEEVRRATPTRRLTTPEDVAAVVGFLCTDEASQINGQALVVDGGL